MSPTPQKRRLDDDDAGTQRYKVPMHDRSRPKANHIVAYKSPSEDVLVMDMATSPSIDAGSPEAVMTPPTSVAETASRTSSHGSMPERTNHVIKLSKLEHCMPRSYIRICFAYPVPSADALDSAISGLKSFVRKIIDAKPYLAGHVANVSSQDHQHGGVEIRFSTKDFEDYPTIKVHPLFDSDKNLVKYSDLAAENFPPSRLKPEEVAILPPDVDDTDSAPVFQIQANLVEGGLILSLYLHHCISDGKGFDLLATGKILNDDMALIRHLDGQGHESLTLSQQLSDFAKKKTAVRSNLSWCSPDQVHTRQIRARRLDEPEKPKNPPGRGCILFISRRKITDEVNRLRADYPEATFTSQNVLMALLWRHMTKARLPSIQLSQVKDSKLLIPVDIRNKLEKPLPASYFGAAVDSARAQLDLNVLTSDNPSALATVAMKVRSSIEEVDEDYVRQGIALALSKNPALDVRDLQGINMDRVNGADMYITSWLKLELYEADLGMGLGKPEFVRKPWSRDPGSCIVLPAQGMDFDHYEVVVQMTTDDMGRLLGDEDFMTFVTKVVE